MGSTESKGRERGGKDDAIEAQNWFGKAAVFSMEVAWPSGLRRWFKVPVSSEAWVRIPPLPIKHFFLFFKSSKGIPPHTPSHADAASQQSKDSQVIST